MPQFCAHTMGMPGRDVFQCLELARDLGFDGIEIRVKEDGQLNPAICDEALLGSVRGVADAYGVRIFCLTPYYGVWIDPARRREELDGLRQVIGIARKLGCPYVRVHGGALDPAGADAAGNRRICIEALSEACDAAAIEHVKLLIETHSGYRTMGAAETRDMVEAVHHSALGVIFDYPWVHVRGRETPEEAVDILFPHIHHVHVKDWKFIDGDVNRRTAALLGEGDLPWPEVFRALRERGYDNGYSNEYEKFWEPEALPEPEVGMKHDLEYMRRHLR